MHIEYRAQICHKDPVLERGGGRWVEKRRRQRGNLTLKNLPQQPCFAKQSLQGSIFSSMSEDLLCAQRAAGARGRPGCVCPVPLCQSSSSCVSWAARRAHRELLVLSRLSHEPEPPQWCSVVYHLSGVLRSALDLGGIWQRIDRTLRSS